MLNKLLALVAVTGLVAGCSSGPPDAKPGTVSEAGADNVVSQTRGISTAVMAGDGSSLSANVNSVAISGAQQIVMPGSALRAEARPQQASGDVNCDANGCTYNQYSVGGYTYNGSITASDDMGGKKIIADLTMKGSSEASGSSTTIDWKITGTLNVTATSIKGQLQSEGTGEVGGVSGIPGGGGISYEYTNLVQYNDVVLNEAGMAVGGSIYARWSIEVDGAGAAGDQGSQAWEGTVNFQ